MVFVVSFEHFMTFRRTVGGGRADVRRPLALAGYRTARAIVDQEGNMSRRNLLKLAAAEAAMRPRLSDRRPLVTYGAQTIDFKSNMMAFCRKSI